MLIRTLKMEAHMKFRLIGWTSGRYGNSKIDRSFTAKNEEDAIKKAEGFAELVCDCPAYHSSSFELCKPICEIKAPEPKKPHKKLDPETSAKRIEKIVRMNNNA